MIDAILKAEIAMERAAAAMAGWFKHPGTTWSGVLTVGFVLESVGGTKLHGAFTILGVVMVLGSLLPCLHLSFHKEEAR